MQFLQTWFKARRQSGASSARFYDVVMAAALDPAHYVSGVAEDTLEGRFGMVTLHSALVMRHLRKYGEAGRMQSRCLYEQVFAGFDYALREAGTSDARIARKVRTLGEEFYGLARALDAALNDSDAHMAISAMLERNQIGGSFVPELADYLYRTDQVFNGIQEKELLSGNFAWQTYAP